MRRLCHAVIGARAGRVQGGDAHPSADGGRAADGGRRHAALLREACRRRHDDLQDHLHPHQEERRYVHSLIHD